MGSAHLSAASVISVHGETLSRCVACGSAKIRFWARKGYAYTLANFADNFDIFRCMDCGTGFLNPPPSVGHLADIYSRSGHALSSSVTLREVMAWEQNFPNSTVDAKRIVSTALSLNTSTSHKCLDVGSGFGFITHEFMKQNVPVTSINPGKFENDVFFELNGHMPFVGMLDDFEPDGQYGVVVLSQVLEHMLSPKSVLDRVGRFVAPGGVLALAVPNFQSIAVRLLGTHENGCLWVPEHVNYFTSRGLRALVGEAGFQPTLESQVTRIRYDAISRRLPSWAWPTATTVLVKYGQRPIATLIDRIGLGLHLNLYSIKR